jgi:NADPH-dependent curcumin reductase CurA
MNIRQIVLAGRPEGMPDVSHFRFEEIPLPEMKEDEVTLKPLFFSVDPYIRGRMNAGKSYISPFEVNAPIQSGAIAEVVETRSSRFKKGDKVLGMLPWATRAILPASVLSSIDTRLAPASYYLGILGMPGLTAYFGLIDIGKPQEGETLVVSGAAGAVGLVVGQLGKIKGCRVVGIAGTEEKCILLKKEFGFDEVINYKKETDLPKALKAACPNGVNMYFDNIGGEISDAVLAQIQFNARVVLCGQISLYNQSSMSNGPRFLPLILTRSALIQGFIISNYKERYPEGIQYLAKSLKEGRLKYTETHIAGFDKLPEAFLGLFSGQNEGKMLVVMEEE